MSQNAILAASQISGVLPSANLTGKELGVGSTSSSQSVTSTASPGTDLTSLTVTATPDGTHPVRVDVSLPQIDCNGTSSGVFIVIQRDGSVVAGFITGPWATTGEHRTLAGFYRETPTNASHTYKLSSYNGGAQTTTFTAGSVTSTAYISLNQVQT